MKRYILLTFDLEEFDIPAEYGYPITEEDQKEITIRGLKNLISLLESCKAPVTFFTTSAIAEHIPDLLKDISIHNEIASHSRTHTGFSASDPLVSRQTIEQIINKPVEGFRMPRFGGIDLENLRSSGYKYDSSVNPTYIPGRYNNFFTSRKPYIDSVSNFIEFPLSVSPVIRFPLFWLSFKNLPFPFYLFLCRQTLNRDSFIHLYFHTWEFENIDGYGLPRYIRAISGTPLLERLGKLIGELNKDACFITVSSYLELCGLKDKK